MQSNLIRKSGVKWAAAPGKEPHYGAYLTPDSPVILMLRQIIYIILKLYR